MGDKMRINSLILLLLIISSAFVCVGYFSEVKAQENVNVLSTIIYQTYGYSPFSVSKGDYIVAGEVKNSGSEVLHFNLTATFYDAAGSIIGTSFLSDSSSDTSPCYLHVLLPNEKSPFALWFSRFDEQGNFRLVDRYDLVVSTAPVGFYQPGLSIISNSSHEAGSSLYVEGNIENIGSSKMDTYNVYVTFYKENGEVLAVSMEGGRALSSDETAAFSVSLNGFNEGGRLEEFSRYEVTAEGYNNSLWTADGQLISPEIVYVLGAPEVTVKPTVVSEGFPYIVYVAAIILVVVILALAILFLRGARKRALK
jgi:hypothetical protein